MIFDFRFPILIFDFRFPILIFDFRFPILIFDFRFSISYLDFDFRVFVFSCFGGFRFRFSDFHKIVILYIMHKAVMENPCGFRRFWCSIPLENCRFRREKSVVFGVPKPAMEMLSKMKNSEIKPDAVSYNTVLGALSRAGLFEEAARLMKEMTSKGFDYDTITYSSILEAVGKIDLEPFSQ